MSNWNIYLDKDRIKYLVKKSKFVLISILFLICITTSIMFLQFYNEKGTNFEYNATAMYEMSVNDNANYALAKMEMSQIEDTILESLKMQTYSEDIN